jgi:CubicO group peptidase (beta-lactamase class C family)
MTMRTLLVALAALSVPASVAAQSRGDVDRVFAKWTSSTPGCAVGVSVAGKPVLARGYGMADLERGVPITADTILETGSVAKQFTAAAVLLLERDGRLSLDDEVRKHIPELPDYGTPLTIRHMLTHTSGLRDWGSVAGIGGWPRGSRAYTQAHVLDIVSRQRALNFAPGTRYSYTNTGYNLAAMIVARVSGMPFAEFTKRRIFEPLGMTHSSWRDDFTRIVKDRAQAYSPQGDGYRLEMPFENAHGNGGMLTTVGDLLKWTNNFASPKVGDAAFVRQQIERGRFTDGSVHGYAMGLQVGTYRGVREISHGGATAGYRTQLSLYPDQGVAVAVLCNATNVSAGAAGTAVADLYLAGKLTEPAAPPAPAATENATPPALSAAQLQELAGRYTSDEAEVVMNAVVEDGALVLKRRPATTIRLSPADVDVFTAPGLGRITFRRDAAGRVTAFSVTQERVWDLRFEREELPPNTARN